MKKTITLNEKLQLLGLITLGMQQAGALSTAEQSIRNLFEVKDGDYSAELAVEAIWDGNTNVDQILENMGVTVDDRRSNA